MRLLQLAQAVSILSLCLFAIARQVPEGEESAGLDAWATTRIVENSTASSRHWSEGKQWWEDWPLPVSQVAQIEADEVMKLLEDARVAKDTASDVLLVDVRRADWGKGGAITSSINVPAHAFYHARSTVYDLCKRANIKRIIFFCRSSHGRGPRCASWMQDYINEIGGDSDDLQPLVMRGGIKGWARTFEGRMMDEYDEQHWRRQEDDE